MPDFSTLIGTPFENGGRGPHSYDCWGLVMAVYDIFGIALPDFQICAFDAVAIGAAIQAQAMEPRWLELTHPQVPCIVTIKNHPRMVNHCGVYVEDGWFLHTMEKTGCVRDKITSPAWRKRLRGFFIYAK